MSHLFNNNKTVYRQHVIKRLIFRSGRFRRHLEMHLIKMLYSDCENRLAAQTNPRSLGELFLQYLISIYDTHLLLLSVRTIFIALSK